MPTIKIGDRCKIKAGRSPLYSQISDWGDNRPAQVFPPEQIFEVTNIEKSKVTLAAVGHEEDRLFEWFKNAVVLVDAEAPVDLSELKSVKAVEKPAIEIGDRVKFKPEHLPNYEDINPSTSRRGIPACTENDIFEVEGVRGSRILVSQGGEPFEWYIHAIKSIIKPQQPSDAVLKNAGEITPGMNPTDGRGYRPSNGTEGSIFTSRWCDRCEKNLNDDCPIYGQAMIGHPAEWVYWGGKPLCTAWELRTTPPKVEPPSISCVVRPDGTKTAIVAEQQPAAEAEPPQNPLKVPKTQAKFTTAWMTHRDVKYRVEGDPKDGRGDGEFYYVTVQAGKEIRSEKPFTGVIPCNQAARKAIDSLAAVQSL